MSATLSRRAFAASLVAAPAAFAQVTSGPHFGSLHSQIQSLADASPIELSYLRPEFRDLGAWQRPARAKLFDLLQYVPKQVAAEAQVHSRVQRDGFTEERLTFRTTPQTRVPAHLLLPSDRRPPYPGVVLLHDHGGFYMWGREKVIAIDNEHPVLTKFKQTYYGGRNVGTELVRQGYAVIAIDMFYWGERRFLLPEDPPAWRERTADLTEQQINDYNKRSGLNEQFIARGLLAAGVTWPGVMLWDDIRTVDYLASRPEVDRSRLACVGLSVGGYRSFLLAALDPRIRAAVDVGWMTAFGSQIESHINHTIGLTFVIPGMYRYFDLPDLAALIAPRAVMVMMGSRDGLFPVSGIESAFAKIQRCFAKAGTEGQQRCRLFPVPHQFNADMQTEAWDWLKRKMAV
jgi:dienelactone hydrolase